MMKRQSSIPSNKFIDNFQQVIFQNLFFVRRKKFTQSIPTFVRWIISATESCGKILKSFEFRIQINSEFTNFYVEGRIDGQS